MDKELIKLLRSVKDNPSLGGGFDARSSWQRFARTNGFDQNTVPGRYHIGDHLTYMLWQISHVLLKPVAATVAVFFFAISGWLSVGNASAHALPGDTFYPIKIGMEKAQLALAFTSQQRANLKVEFASRRLEEMVQIASLVEHRQPAEVQLAVNRFKDEVTNIQEELQVEEASDSQTELAKTVGRKVNVYSSTVASTNSELPDEVLVEVEDLLEETKDQVVEVIITAHEQEKDEESAYELDVALQVEIASIQSVYGTESEVAVETAQALRVEGSYRRAFQVLKDFSYNQEILLTEETEETTETIQTDTEATTEQTEEIQPVQD
jgi:hypothetical protein